MASEVVLAAVLEVLIERWGCGGAVAVGVVMVEGAGVPDAGIDLSEVHEEGAGCEDTLRSRGVACECIAIL